MEISESNPRDHLCTSATKEYKQNGGDGPHKDANLSALANPKPENLLFPSRTPSLLSKAENFSSNAARSSIVDCSIVIEDIGDKQCSNETPLFKEPQLLKYPNECGSHPESELLSYLQYFSFLDDFIRFDVSRTGISCVSGYSVGVQYEDDFMLEKGISPCCLNVVCSARSRVRLYHQEKAFEVEYFPRVSCTRPKNCTYHVKIPENRNTIGTIYFQKESVHIHNTNEQSLCIRKKQGSNSYLIRSESGERVASVEIFRGLRGDILYYGLSILADVSSTDKALLIGLTVAMDIRQRESEMRCSLIWVPLCCVVVIGLFSFLPWLYFYDAKS